ncbi:MAG: serine protease, peptidase S9 family protein [Chitinophagaceae bacterium]|nr:MAG: serine protease, peptidase S9 family protein [Chitinophagaceae bacterium]
MKQLIILPCLLVTYSITIAQFSYPATKTVDSSDIYFGITYKDPYRWLEHMKEAPVEDWYKQQADYTSSILNNLHGRDALIAEWKMLDKLQPPRINSRNFEGGRIFYNKTMPGENVSKLYYREGMEGKEILLFDPQNYIKGKTLSIQSALPSYDGKKILIGYSESGAEVSTIKIMDVATKTFSPETIYPSWFGPISWTHDNKAFTYFSQKTGDSKSHDFELNTKTKLHILGQNVKDDIDFISNESYPALNIAPNELPFAWVDKHSRNHIFADLSNVRSEMMTYYAPISQLMSKKIEWKVLCKPEDGIVRGRVILGDDVYAITHKNAKNYKLIHTTLSNPDWSKADVIAAERPGQTLEYIVPSRDFLLLVYSDGINTQLSKYNFKTKESTPINLPYSGSMNVFCLDQTTNECYVGISTWNKPYTEYAFNANTEVLTESKFNPAPVFPDAYKDLVVEEVEVKGHDGTMIPLSIIYKKGMKKDGNNVCLMNSYGAYGSSMTPWFNPMENALAVKNVVLAYPHVRGGSEKGQEWYKAGYKTTKPNTWKDFNSCAEYLISNGYTSPARLAGTGTSAGGILISRAITERPDLYAAAINNVGCSNAMRGEFTPNGPANIPEFGTVKDSIECKALYEMDGMQHVVKGTKYPAVISIAGWNDPRVIAWQPGKFAAAVQQASASGKPSLLKINYDNGHFTEDKSVTFANFADQFAFAMWQCGHPDFQPIK